MSSPTDIAPAAPRPVSRAYLALVGRLQNVSLGVSLAILATLPSIVAFAPERLAPDATSFLFALSLLSATLVMAVRPLADLLPDAAWLRPLVVLRKGFGVFSASIVVSFFLAKILAHSLAPIAQIFTAGYWSLSGFAILAHLGDLAAIPLLATSNKFSRRAMGPWWKRLQKLSYVYFYAGALYEAAALGSGLAVASLVVVTALTLAAYIKNAERRPALA